MLSSAHSSIFLLSHSKKKALFFPGHLGHSWTVGGSEPLELTKWSALQRCQPWKISYLFSLQEAFSPGKHLQESNQLLYS